VSWTVNQFFAVILLIWILVLFVQSLLGLFKVRLSTAQLFGLILVIGGVFWILYVLPNSPLQDYVAHSALPDPWYLLGGLLITYGVRYLMPAPTKDIVAALLCVAVVIGGFYIFKTLTPPQPQWQGQQQQQQGPGYDDTPARKGNRPFPAPLKIYGLRSTPLEALTWAEEETSSALSFHLDFGSLYVGQQPSKEYGFGAYQYVFRKTASSVYELTPQSGREGNGALFLGSQVTSVDIAASYGSLYVEITQPMNSILVDSRMGDITVDSAAQIESIVLGSYAGNINLALNEHVKHITVDSRAGNINVSTSTVVDLITVRASAGNLNITVPQGVKVEVENVGGVGRFNNDSDPQGYNGTMKLYLDMKMGNVDIRQLP